jgi:hypothetical protein
MWWSVLWNISNRKIYLSLNLLIYWKEYAQCRMFLKTVSITIMSLLCSEGLGDPTQEPRNLLIMIMFILIIFYISHILLPL